MKGFLTYLHFSIIQEYRSWHQLVGIFVFSWLIAHVAYRIKGNLDVTEFALVFWMFVVLISINIAMRAENHFSRQEALQLYTLSSPIQFLAARIVFTILYLLLSSIGFYVCLLLFFYPAIKFDFDFLALILLLSVVISACLSFVSAISIRTSSQNILLSILSLPLLLPAIILLSQLSIQHMMGAGYDTSKIISLLGLSLLSIASTILLYPYIWRQ